MFHLLEGPALRKHYWDDREEKKKRPAPGGIQTHDLSVMRRALYRCATTPALLQLPNNPSYHFSLEVVAVDVADVVEAEEVVAHQDNQVVVVERVGMPSNL